MIRLLPMSILSGALAMAAMACAAEDYAPKAETQQPPLIRLAPQATAQPPTALHYRLLPDSSELIVGNAAPYWHKAINAERDASYKITQEEYKWAESDFLFEICRV